MNIVLSTLNAKYIHSSLALRYLRAYAEQDYTNIQLVEYTIKDIPNQIVADLYKRKPDVVGFSIYIWNVEETIPIIQMLKKVLPNVTIVLGGPEVTYDVMYWMNRIPEVDCIVVGEGEATFRQLLHEIEGDKRYNRIPGVAWRKEDQIVINQPAPKLDLNQIPSPFSHPVDVQELRNRIVYFESSRGCPFSCQFCLSSIESGVRYFDIDRVKQRLRRLIESGIRTI